MTQFKDKLNNLYNQTFIQNRDNHTNTNKQFKQSEPLEALRNIRGLILKRNKPEEKKLSIIKSISPFKVFKKLNINESKSLDFSIISTGKILENKSLKNIFKSDKVTNHSISSKNNVQGNWQQIDDYLQDFKKKRKSTVQNSLDMSSFSQLKNNRNFLSVDKAGKNKLLSEIESSISQNQNDRFKRCNKPVVNLNIDLFSHDYSYQVTNASTISTNKGKINKYPESKLEKKWKLEKFNVLSKKKCEDEKSFDDFRINNVKSNNNFLKGCQKYKN